MEFMQMEMFVAVVEEGTVQKAADRVHRTQPAVSLGIARLEREIGLTLLDHSRKRGRRPRMTSAGEVLYEYASRILRLRSSVLSAMGVHAEVSLERLSIGLSESRRLAWVYRRTTSFNRENPMVRVAISCDSPDRLLWDLAERKLDMVFLPAAPPSGAVPVDLVVAPIPCGRGEGLWLVECRAGRSSAARLFERWLTRQGKAHMPESKGKCASGKPRAGSGAPGLKKPDEFTANLRGELSSRIRSDAG